jgi:hypothetical protein
MLCALPFASSLQKRAYRTCADAFANYLQFGSSNDPSYLGRGGSEGFMYDDGSVGLGYRHENIDPAGINQPHIDTTPFPVASGIVGARFSSLYSSLTKNPFFKEFSTKALTWLINHGTEQEGFVRYYLPPRTIGSFGWEVCLTAYCGEGWLWAMHNTLSKEAEKHTLKNQSVVWLDWLLKQQNEQGLWNSGNQHDLDRSPLAPFYLMGYHNIYADREDVVVALNKFILNIQNNERKKNFYFMERKRSTVFTGLLLAEYLWAGKPFRLS